MKDLKSNALTVEEVKSKMENGSIVIDSRKKETFTEGFIPNSIFIGLEGRFEQWALALLPVEASIIIVADENKENETIEKLSTAGFNNIAGYLKDGFDTWQNAGETIDMIIDIEPDELEMDLPHDPKLQIIDVREENEFNEEHLVNSVNVPLADLTDVGTIAEFEENQNLYIHCKIGYRSVIACTLFKRHGIHNVRNVLGGILKIKEATKIKMVTPKSPQQKFSN